MPVKLTPSLGQATTIFLLFPMSTPGEGNSQLKLGGVFPAESLQRLPLRLHEALLASSLTPFQVIFEVFTQPVRTTVGWVLESCPMSKTALVTTLWH